MTTRALRRPIVRGSRKERQWGITIANGSIIGVTQATSLAFNLTDGLETTLGSEAHNWTVAALKYNLDFVGLAAGAVNDDFTVAAGVTWVNNDALAAGPVSLPSPSDDNADWMWYSAGHFTFENAVAKEAPMNRSGFVIDNQSMRKQRENNSSLVLIVRGVLTDRTVQVFLSGRALFLLP